MIFTVPGEPCAKGRPRFSRQGQFVRTYTPAKTANYENLVVLEYQNAGGKMHDGMISMTVKAFYPIPKSTSKKQRSRMVNGVVRPTKKPDTDNILKIVADALNGIAYKDDSQIVTSHIEKWYSDEPHMDVNIEEVRHEGLCNHEC